MKKMRINSLSFLFSNSKEGGYIDYENNKKMAVFNNKEFFVRNE